MVFVFCLLSLYHSLWSRGLYVDTLVDVRDHILDLNHLRAPARNPDEVSLPDDGASSSSGPHVDQAIVESLMMMGFESVPCRRAAYETGNRSAEEAMTWLLEHMGDDDINMPLEQVVGGGGAVGEASAGPPPPPQEAIDTVCMLGFTPKQAKYALSQTVESGSVFSCRLRLSFLHAICPHRYLSLDMH